MKKCLVLIILLAVSLCSFSQVLLETLDGDEMVLNTIGIKNSLIIGSVNSSEQSLQFKTLFALPNNAGVVPTRFITLGLKGKPTDGISTLFSGDNFNATTNINLAYSKVNLFSTIDSKFTDFYSIRVDYAVSKFTLFKNDTAFNKQISNFNFEGGGISFTYNVLFNGKDLLTFGIGYSQKNNYSKLKSVEIRDFTTTLDTLSGTFRQYGEVVNGKMGDYKEYEIFPIKLSYTFCPSEAEEDKAKLKFGYTIYYRGEFGKKSPIHDLGTILFLTKQNDKSGVRVPIIGLGIQANDLNDSLNKGNKIPERLSVTLTTTFNITSL